MGDEDGERTKASDKSVLVAIRDRRVRSSSTVLPLDVGDNVSLVSRYRQFQFHYHNFSPSSPDMPLGVPQQSWFPRRSSISSQTPTQSHTALLSPSPKLKGKERSLDDSLFDVGARYALTPDNIPTTVHDPSARSHSHSSSQIRSPSVGPSSKQRTSILSDPFGFRRKIGSVSRKKPNLHSLAHPTDLPPDIIEINASNNTTTVVTIAGTTPLKDCECEERERLRDAAAQSIGLDPVLLHHSSRFHTRSSLDSPKSPPLPARIPPFPSTLAALRPFTQLSSTLPKFTPPSSLLVYALAKQWKSRTIILTSHSPSHKTHVHLFKGSSKDDKELERLEVTENSVIFVPEEDLGGRRHVVKLAGKNASGKRTGEDSVHSMWFLQITDPAESQRWIATVKNAVLTQRAVRAGLDISAQSNGRNEPKGDIDVMLSMHLQGLIPTHPSTDPLLPPVPASPSPPPSLRSLRLSVPSSHSILPGSRPRSPSVEGSPAYPLGHAEDSFGVVGTSLLTMLRTKSSAESTTSPSHSLALPLSHMPERASPTPSLRSTNVPVIISGSDLKISKERDAPGLPTPVLEVRPASTPPTSNVSHGALTLSLQPPPRKCKLATPVLPEQQEMYKQAGGNRSVAGNFGISCGGSGDATPRETSPVSPCFSGGLSDSFSSSLRSEMRLPFTGEHGELDDGIIDSPSPRSRSVPSDKHFYTNPITKRWSRQGIPLPKQLTPPSGPPPSVPTLEYAQRTSIESSVSMPAAYNTDRSPGSSSSNSHSQVRFGSTSVASLSPTFWKRASLSSGYSCSSTSLSSSLGSFTGRGSSSRPMSLLVPVSTSAGHTGAIKRRSMPPPRPAPNFAPPPAPAIQESASEPTPLTSVPVPVSRKSFRSSVAQRALRLSLTSPKPPPSSALPPRPDEFASGHRRSSSIGTSDCHSTSAPSSRPSSAFSAKSRLIEPVSLSSRNLSFKQRLRILSTPPRSPSPPQSPSFSTPSVQVSTLDLSDDNDDDDPPTPCFQNPHTFALGEHIITMQNEPSFLQLSTPVTPTAPKPVFHSPFRPMSPLSSPTSGFQSSPFEPDRDFIALSPPPPRKGSKPYVGIVKRPEEGSGPVQREESKLLRLSQRGSVVSLGLVTT